MKPHIVLALLVLVWLGIACAPTRTDSSAPQQFAPAVPNSNNVQSQPAAAPTEIPPPIVPIQIVPTQIAPTQIAPTIPPLPTEVEQLTAVSKIDLKVRSGPGTNFPQTGVLKQGTRVTLLGRSQDGSWLQHERGWSSAAYLETEADVSSLPIVVIEAPPPITKPPTAAFVAIPPTRIPPTKVQVVEAPTTASNCDPNYTPCVPIASDVDCAGGSGNGPAYVQGPVRVIGVDIYGLDRDGDGIGCDR